MKPVTILAAAVLAVSTMAVSLGAQGRGNGQAKKTATSTPAVKPAAHPTKTAVKAETHVAKTNTKPSKSPTTTTTTKHAAKATAKAETRAAKNETKVTPTTPTTQRVKNPKLESRLLALLPPGTNIQDASQGFKNWGQFVAATHVSNNLGIPFDDLKSRMTGLTPGSTVPATTPMSLGQAIQSLKGTATTPETGELSPTKIRTEVKKAEDAAETELRSTRDHK